MNIAKIVSPIMREHVLTQVDRDSTPKSKEGVPEKHGKSGAYPMPDKQHAAAAKGFAAMHHGKGSAVYKKVAAKAANVLKSK